MKIMRKLVFLIFIAILAGVALGGVAIAADVDEEGDHINSADIDLIVAVDEVLSELGDALESGESGGEMIAKINASIVVLQDLTSHEFSQEVSQDYLDQSDVVQQAATGLIDKLATLRQAYVDGGDEATVVAASDEMSLALEEYIVALEDLDGIVEGVETPVDEWRDFYLIMLITTFVLAFGSFVWAFMWPESIADRLKSRQQIAYISLAPLVGAAITYFGYKLMPAGGEYTIAWGAIIFGLIAYGRAVLLYRKMAKVAD